MDSNATARCPGMGLVKKMHHSAIDFVPNGTENHIVVPGFASRWWH